MLGTTPRFTPSFPSIEQTLIYWTEIFMPHSSENPLPIEIDVQSVRALIEEQADFLLIDCREPDEHEFCRIESAKLIPMNQTPSRVEEFESHRDSQIVVHCHHGSRSMQVVQWLRSQGFSGAQNMAESNYGASWLTQKFLATSGSSHCRHWG